MDNKFSKTWNRSTQARKQRKFRRNAPHHIRNKFVSAHLSPELRKKYGMRSLRLRKGDKVRIMRGGFQSREGKIQTVDVRNEKIYIEGIEITRRDGSKAQPPLRPSNLMILEVNRDDAKRMAKLGEKPTPKTEKKKESPKSEKKEAKPESKKEDKKEAPKKETPKEAKPAEKKSESTKSKKSESKGEKK